jgi:co-chaperonin GroES (HSP10)
MLIPTNNRIIATLVEVEKTEIDGMEGHAQLDKYSKVKVVKSSVEQYKKGQILVVPSYVDRIKDGKKEYMIIHESDVVAIEE